MKATRKELIIFLFFFTHSVVFGSGECGNTIVTCFEDGDELDCEVRGQDTEAIQEKIYECSQGSYYYLDIEILVGGAGATLNINIPSNIETLEIENQFYEPVFVETSTINYNVTQIVFYDYEVFINHNDFFTYFPNLEYFEADILGSNLMPFFSQNIHLIDIEVHSSFIREESSRVIDRTLVGGLDKLEVLYWESGGITKLMSDSFNGTYKLRRLNLDNNEIHELYDCIFDGLHELEKIYLSNNDITTVGEYTFIDLDALEDVRLRLNPSFPLSTLTLAKSIENIHLDNYNPALLSPEIFEQFPQLSYLSFEYIAFDCTCETEWIYILEDVYNVEIELDSYNFCPGNPDLQVKDPSLYVNCANPNYQCFDHSIVCQGYNWYRVDTETGCNCTYPPERALYNNSSFVCSDIDECEDSSITCQGNCTNTLGSYTCDCDEGFVNLNETFCYDVNECEESSVVCEGYCTNTLGSYTCDCAAGFVKYNNSICNEVNECGVNNGGCPQDCTNTIGSFYCSCFDGYNISTSDNSDCEFITTSPQISNFGETEFILVVFAVIVFVLILLLVLLIVVILFCLYLNRGLHKKHIPEYNPTIAELDNMKEAESVIENQLPESEVETLKDANVSSQV
ncbi:latent-transforming growth factor beta-binding protein 2 [Oopsacas minuta]|uniref:Latent-transforming growth factor beta-binding protein 2 n=1 Tax=Oopsacas minuta TaxID=111878 RepID=A0AAV7KC69_9METZ|nr:latent-transforming growth factor beta-binding protein 2 [Oopsacas minuta]